MSAAAVPAAGTVRATLRAGGHVVAFNVFESLRPSVAKILAQSGYDVVLVETEHMLHDPETLTSFLVIARDNGLCPVVTIPAVSRADVARLLDAGALGICLSHAESVEQVEALVRWMKYPPHGARALGHGPGAGYRITDAAAHCRESNEATVLALKIESVRGVEHAAQMLSVSWVDAVVFGPGDLAADMGLHGGWQHPEVIAAMEGVVELALARGIAVEAAVAPADRADFERQRERGIRIFGPTRASEYDALRAAAERLIAPLKP